MQSHLVKTAWQSIELAMNMVLCSRMKLPQRNLSSGSTLRLSLNIIRDTVYNYNLGTYTQQCRYIFALAMCPSLVKHWLQYESPMSVFYGCLILFDMLTTVDLVPSNQSDLLYSMTMLIRLIKTVEILYGLTQSLLNFPKLELRSIKVDRKVKTCKVESTEKTMMSQQNDQEKTTATSSQPPSQDDSQKDEEVNKKKTTKKYHTKFPVYKFTVKQPEQYEIVIEDPMEFDQAFAHLQMDRRTLLQVKLYYSNTVYHKLKKSINKNDEAILSKYLNMIATYQSELILLDY